MMKKLLILFFCAFSGVVAQGQSICFTQLEVTDFCTVALASNGKIYGWGSNDSEQLGWLGANDTVKFGAHAFISPDTDWVAISAGGSTVFALKSNGTLWSWGACILGACGQTNFTAQPMQVGTATDWARIYVGYLNAFAIKTNGTLWATGYNHKGQLGLGHKNEVLTFTQVGTGNNWQSVYPFEYTAGINRTLGIKTDGTLWGWGDSTTTYLGHNYKSYPTQIGTDTNWASASLGSDNNFMLKTNGTLWVVGSNYWSENGLGIQSSTATTVITQKPGTYTKVVAGDNAAFAIKTDGTLIGWGYNYKGKLGPGHDNLVLVGESPQLPAGMEIESMGFGWFHSCILGKNGKVYASGKNELQVLGQVNKPTTFETSVPLLVNITCTGLSSTWEEIQENRMLVYPNPSDGRFTIASEEIESPRISLYNAIGVLSHTAVPDVNGQVDIRALPNGIYWGIVHNKDGVAVGSIRVVKE